MKTTPFDEERKSYFNLDGRTDNEEVMAVCNIISKTVTEFLEQALRRGVSPVEVRALESYFAGEVWGAGAFVMLGYSHKYGYRT